MYPLKWDHESSLNHARNRGHNINLNYSSALHWWERDSLQKFCEPVMEVSGHTDHPDVSSSGYWDVLFHLCCLKTFAGVKHNICSVITFVLWLLLMGGCQKTLMGPVTPPALYLITWMICESLPYCYIILSYFIF